MADPISMLAIGSLAASAIGGGVSAYGAMAQGEAQQRMYNYQAQVAQINSQIAEQQANVEQMAGEVRAQQKGLEAAAQWGGTVAAIGAGDLIPDEKSSAKAVLASETEITQHDQAITRYDSAQRAYALRVQGAQDTMQGQLDIAAGEGARTAGDINAYASLLGTAGSVSNKWIQYGPKGLGILS